MPNRIVLPERPPGKAPARRWSRDRVVGALGVGAFLVGSAIMVARKGLFIQTDTVFIWVIAGLVALSLTDLRRFGPRLLLDWLPLALLFILYDYSRNLSEWLGTPTHMYLQIHFDEFLFGKPLLTLKLQHLFGQTKAVRPWEYLMFGVYMTHFFLDLVIAAFLWRFAYPRFRQYRAQLVTLFTLGFLTYALYPADPPWIVSQKLHKLPTIYRAVFEVWGHIGLHTAGSILEHGNEFGNQLAAVPSMHAAVSLFICLFFWRGARAWLRAVLVVYVLAMAFTLVYSGEHYVFDVVVGWFYAVLVIAGAFVIARLRASRSTAAERAAAHHALAGTPAQENLEPA
jgi:membrane-associated phospholipid phosphatase